MQAKYRLWIHSETRTWHDNNIQSSVFIFKTGSRNILSL